MECSLYLDIEKAERFDFEIFSCHANAQCIPNERSGRVGGGGGRSIGRPMRVGHRRCCNVARRQIDGTLFVWGEFWV